MKKSFFYTSHVLAVAVFYSFYMFMLWASVDMGSEITDTGATFWTVLTEIGLLALAGAGLVLFLIAAYNLLVKGLSEAPFSRPSPLPQSRGARHSAATPA